MKTSAFWSALQSLCGVSVSRAAVSPLEGKPLRAGDLVIGDGSQEHYLVVSDILALREGKALPRKEGWRWPAEDRVLTLTLTDDGRVLFASVQTEEGEIMDVLWGAPKQLDSHAKYAD